MKQLNLGCGKDIRKGYVNLDIYPLEGVDVVADIEKNCLLKTTLSMKFLRRMFWNIWRISMRF